MFAQKLVIQTSQKRLLEAGGKIEAADNEGFRAIHHATQRGHVGIVEMLIEAGADIDAKTREGTRSWSALEIAVFVECAPMVQALLAAGARKDAISVDCVSALHLAAGIGSEEVARYLVEVGAELNAMTCDGETPVETAVRCGQQSLAQLLQRKDSGSANVSSRGGLPELISDAEANRVLAISKLMEAVILDPAGESEDYKLLCEQGGKCLRAACLWNVIMAGRTPAFIESYIKTIGPRCNRWVEAKRCARAILIGAASQSKSEQDDNTCLKVMLQHPDIAWMVRTELKAMRRNVTVAEQQRLDTILALVW